VTATATRGYLVRRLADAPTVPCPCGRSTRPLTAAETPTCNLHVTFIRDSVKHFHKECTEVYYILEGRGKMELNGDTVDVEPGTVILIEPYTTHRLVSEEGVRTIVFGVPAGGRVLRHRLSSGRLRTCPSPGRTRPRQTAAHQRHARQDHRHAGQCPRRDAFARQPPAQQYRNHRVDV
jgi:mannose-6-phosphate isomerase-like protein (cupin superfamily)